MNNTVKKVLLSLVTFVIFLLLWQSYIMIFKIPSHILPGPFVLYQDLVRTFQIGEIYKHINTTLYEIGVGFIIGVILGLVMGYVVAKNKWFERLISPYIILIQTIPKISIAPLFLLWFGLGVSSKVALVVLVVFFPIMINFVVGIRSVENNMQDLLEILKANRWQRFISVEFMYSLPSVMSGIKVGVTYAITGAVIGEMIGADSGLGYLVILGSETYNINMILTAVILLSLIGLILYLIVDVVEKKVIHWNKSQNIIM